MNVQKKEQAVTLPNQLSFEDNLWKCCGCNGIYLQAASVFVGVGSVAGIGNQRFNIY
jgi:hypothetical protein